MADEKDEKKITAHSLKCKESVWVRFKDLKDEMDDINTDGQALERLIDVYEEPPKTKILDKELSVKNEELTRQIEELLKKIESQNQEITTLKQQLENTLNDGNESAMSAQRLQMELDKAQEQIKALEEAAEHQTEAKANRPENVFEVEVHPVPFYFLKKMAEHISKEKKTEITPGYVLVDLFLKDLQNPRSNNLPYVVTTSEIEKVLNAYKKEHPEEYQQS